MDISPSQDISPSPSQPPQNPTSKRKAASTVVASNKKPRIKKAGVPKTPVAQPTDDSLVANTAAPVELPVELMEAQLMEDMEGMIATAAYYLAERRNFAPGHELDDWLEAEQQLRR